MATIVENKQKLKVIQFSQDETCKLGWGIPDRVESRTINGIEVISHVGNNQHKGKCICCRCNEKVEEPYYYVVVLNDVFCKPCYDDYMEDAINYKEDRPYEKKAYDTLVTHLKELNIPLK